MADLASPGSACRANPDRDSGYVAGGHVSAAKTTSNDAFLATRNPMAPGSGQQAHTVAGF